MMPTDRQLAILDYISHHIRLHGLPPTRTEIMRHFGFSSPNTVQGHIKALEAKGFVTVQPGKSRGLLPTKHRIDHECENDWLPLVAQVKHHEPLLSEDNIETHMPIPPELFPERGDYLVRVWCDALIHIGVMEGQILVMKKDDDAPHNAVVVVRVNGEILLRCWRRKGNFIRLIPYNLLDSPRTVAPLDGVEVVLEGRAVGMLRRTIWR